MDKKHLLGLKTAIRTLDLEASKAFYSDILQMEVEENYDDGDGSKGIVFYVGPKGSTSLLEISAIDPKHDYFQDAFGRKFANDKVDLQIRCESVEYWAARLKNHDWPYRGPVRRPWGAWYLYLRDPDGIQIIIYEEE